VRCQRQVTMLQYVAVCYSVLHCVRSLWGYQLCALTATSQYAAKCCSILQCVTVREVSLGIPGLCVASDKSVCCSMLQCVTVRCSVSWFAVVLIWGKLPCCHVSFGCFFFEFKSYGVPKSCALTRAENPASIESTRDVGVL